jgi:hypothetical protein
MTTGSALLAGLLHKETGIKVAVEVRQKKYVRQNLTYADVC